MYIGTRLKSLKSDDRIHRIGQKKEVTIHCLYVSNSIEMRLKELVDKKDMVCRVIVECEAVNRYNEGWLTRMHKID